MCWWSQHKLAQYTFAAQVADAGTCTAVKESPQHRALGSTRCRLEVQRAKRATVASLKIAKASYEDNHSNCEGSFQNCA